MMFVRSRDELAVLPMGGRTRWALQQLGIDTVGALFDAPEEVLEEHGQARRLVRQMAEGDGEIGLLEWGMTLPGKRGSLYWTMDDEGCLTVYGSGKMKDYTPDAPAPWEPLRDQIRSLRIEEAVENVGAMAFAGCCALRSVVLSDSVCRIGANAFRDCTALERVESPRELANWRTAAAGQIAVGKDAFAGTPWYAREEETFRIRCGVLVEYLGDETRVEIPDGVRRIAPMVFEGKAVAEVILPRSLESIGACAFRGTKLREVSLPKGLARVEEWAFSDIPTLERVIIHNKRMTAHRSSFTGTPVAGQSVPRDGRWPSLLALNSEQEAGITCARKLSAGPAPGRRIGVPTMVTRNAWRERLKQGEMLLRIIPDGDDRYVKHVQAFYLHPYYGFMSILVEPCWGRSGCVEPWRDEEIDMVPLSEERVDLTGLRRPGKTRWYTMPYTRFSEYDKPLVLLEQWLRVHPEYEIRTLNQCLEGWWPGPCDAA